MLRLPGELLLLVAVVLAINAYGVLGGRAPAPSPAPIPTVAETVPGLGVSAQEFVATFGLPYFGELDFQFIGGQTGDLHLFGTSEDGTTSLEILGPAADVRGVVLTLRSFAAGTLTPPARRRLIMFLTLYASDTMQQVIGALDSALNVAADLDVSASTGRVNVRVERSLAKPGTVTVHLSTVGSAD